MKKNIAILTQPLGHNYGGIIQNYALIRILEREGFFVETINRVDENPHSQVKRKMSFIKQYVIKKMLNKNILTTSDYRIIYKSLVNFLFSYSRLSQKIETTEELKKHFQKNRYDAVIVGSDQTWRPKYSPNIYNYFLDFLENDESIKKIAYASSFGTSEWEFNKEETHRCAELAKKFDAVSVREKSGVDLCSDYLDVKAEWVLDPTLLLTKEDYKAVVNKKNLPKRSGLFSYVLDENDKITKTIEHIADILELEHFTNQPKWRRNDKAGKSLEELKYPSVEGWLKAFDDADFVVTNSFHGTVFSIIFNKPFLTIVNKERGASRFHSLLSEFGLEYRLVEEGDENIKEIVQSPVDFRYANQRREELKKDSLEFLFTNI